MSARSFSLRPDAWPRSGPVSRLYLKYAGGAFASVYVEQSSWPRQRTNPRWRITVEKIDWRYDSDTRSRIHKACEGTAREGLVQWLSEHAPAVSIETVSWLELVRFATASSSGSKGVVKRRSKPLPRPYSQRSNLKARFPVEPHLME